MTTRHSITSSNLLLFVEALFLLFRFKFALTFSSFKALSEKNPCTGTIDNIDKEDLKRIRKAVRRAAKFTWWKNKCLVNTFCARKMLNRRNIKSAAYLGLRKDNIDDVLNAHAWISSNDVLIVPIECEYTRMYEF